MTSGPTRPDGPPQAHLEVHNLGETLGFLMRAFRAEVQGQPPLAGTARGPMAIQIGHTLVTLREAATRLAALRKTPVVWVEDVDGAFQRALDEGATAAVLPRDQSSGGRTASFIDPQGNRWRIVSQKTRLTDAEVERRLAEQRKNRL